MEEERNRLRDGRDEMNLCEFPIAALSDRAPRGVTSLDFSRVEVEAATGKSVTRQLTVEGSTRYGLPTALDEELALGALQLTKAQNGFEKPLVYFTQLELLELLAWGRQTKDYRRLEKAFYRLLGVRFYYQNAWRNNAEKVYETKGGFGLIESFELRDSRKRKRPCDESQMMLIDVGPERSLSWFRWNSVIFQSFQDGYVKKLDYALVRRLERNQSKRLYRYLDKHFYPPNSLTLEYDLKTLAHETLGLSRGYEDKANILRYLAPAVEELEAIGFIERAGRNRRYQKKDGRWVVFFKMKRQPERKIETNRPAESGLAEELLKRGVENGQELVRKYAAQKIERAIENYDDRLAEGEEIGPGWLGANIVHEVGYGFRKGYKSKDEREAEVKKLAARRAKAVLEKARREERQRAKEEAEEQAVQVHLASLTEAEREEFKSRALEASSLLAKQYRTTGDEMYLDVAMKSYLRKERQGKLIS